MRIRLIWNVKWERKVGFSVIVYISWFIFNKCKEKKCVKTLSLFLLGSSIMGDFFGFFSVFLMNILFWEFGGGEKIKNKI